MSNKTLMRRYIEWKYPEHNLRLEMLIANRESDFMLVVYTYMPLGVPRLSKKRIRNEVRVSVWDMIEYQQHQLDKKIGSTI